MSTFLYELGRDSFRHHRRVLLIWLGVLAVVGALAASFGGTYKDAFEIPGAPSQIALQKLQMTFPAAAAQQATAIVIAPEGQRVDDARIKASIEAGVTAFETVPVVDVVTSPWNDYISGLVSDDGRAALIQLQLHGKDFTDITDDDRAALVAEAAKIQDTLPAGTTVNMGGQAFAIEVPSLSATEALGLVVALVVLVLTLGSMLAAGVPLLTSVLGVGLTLGIMTFAAGLTNVNSTTPMLAVMLGLAVGIDYALFILSRHRDQLRDGMDLEESAARSNATAGSAVVFAGLTVVIALVGLSVANIPFLTVMGVFAAVGVALAVVIALTLLPALMGFLGERLRPRASRKKADAASAPQGGVFDLWVRAVTKVPLLTIAVVLVVLGALSFPAKDLWMSLPNSGQHSAGQADRVTYDLIEEHFGPGANGAVIVTADIIGSTDPLGVMDGLRADIEALPGVKLVALATPNQNADTGFVQVVPTTGPDDPATPALVHALRDQHDTWLEKYGVETAVTGITSIQIDITDRLTGALLPFGVFVVGLSLVLLMMVFRSIWVPIKATLGFLLSVGSAFGATQLVFNRGWGAGLINLEEPQAIISFMPIIVMGILFGLAMDYEVFLVSRMREDFVHSLKTSDASPRLVAQRAVREGFVHSGKVVFAAGLIMFAVFAFFVPNGHGPIKPIAFALAVGVAVDAFVVRMILVPAVQHLLGEHAWWLPSWLDKRLPSFDVEGDSLAHQLGLADWPTPDHTEALHAEGVAVDGVFEPLDLHLEPGEVVALVGESASRSAAMLALAGRLRLDAGQARIAGELLPEQAARVRRQTGFVEVPASGDASSEISHVLGRRPRVVFVDAADTLTEATDRAALILLLDEARGGRGFAVVLGVTDTRPLAGLGFDQVVPIRRAGPTSPTSPAPAPVRHDDVDSTPALAAAAEGIRA